MRSSNITQGWVNPTVGLGNEVYKTPYLCRELNLDHSLDFLNSSDCSLGISNIIRRKSFFLWDLVSLNLPFPNNSVIADTSGMTVWSVTGMWRELQLGELSLKRDEHRVNFHKQQIEPSSVDDLPFPVTIITSLDNFLYTKLQTHFQIKCFRSVCATDISLQ